MTKVFVEDIRNIILEVFCIGYSTKGESQLILIKDSISETIYFSSVIDCYSENKINITLSLLEKYNIKSLNLLVWTHPDEDHSVGFDTIIDRYCDGETKFILPEGLTGINDEFIDYNDAVKKTFDLISKFNIGRSYNVNSASVVSGNYSIIEQFAFSDIVNNAVLKLNVKAIAPISAIIRRRMQGGLIKKNDVSIATIFEFGELSFLFGGDIENQTIRQIPSEYFKGLAYIKMPHHTSESSSELLSKLSSCYIQQKVPLANTTIFKANNLPNESMVSKYLKYIDKFSSTGEGVHTQGYIKTIFGIVNKNIISEDHWGTAHYLN